MFSCKRNSAHQMTSNMTVFKAIHFYLKFYFTTCFFFLLSLCKGIYLVFVVIIIT